MSNITDIIRSTIGYLQNMGMSIDSVSPLRKNLTDKLPVAFNSNYQLFGTKLLGRDYVFAIDKTAALSPAQAKKSVEVMQSRLTIPVVIVFTKLPAYEIPRLIAKHVDFIIPGKQMFIPSMMIDIKKPKIIDGDIKERIHPIAQVILLYQMEIGGLQGLTTRAMADLLRLSYATVNRSVRWLKGKELVQLSGDKEKSITFTCYGKNLWDKSKEYLSTPINRIVYTDDNVHGLPESGGNALAEFSMINRESQDCFAIGRGDLGAYRISANSQFGNTKIEIWRYDPRLIAKGNTVDPLSLYLSLRDNEDERIQMELDTLLENIKWSEE